MQKTTKNLHERDSCAKKHRTQLFMRSRIGGFISHCSGWQSRRSIKLTPEWRKHYGVPDLYKRVIGLIVMSTQLKRLLTVGGRKNPTHLRDGFPIWGSYRDQRYLKPKNTVPQPIFRSTLIGISTSVAVNLIWRIGRMIKALYQSHWEGCKQGKIREIDRALVQGTDYYTVVCQNFVQS